MLNWSEVDWAEWRAERAAILLDSGYDGPNVIDHVATLEALERLRLRCEARGFRYGAADNPKQMELQV